MLRVATGGRVWDDRFDTRRLRLESARQLTCADARNRAVSRQGQPAGWQRRSGCLSNLGIRPELPEAGRGSFAKPLAVVSVLAARHNRDGGQDALDR